MEVNLSKDLIINEFSILSFDEFSECKFTIEVKKINEFDSTVKIIGSFKYTDECQRCLKTVSGVMEVDNTFIFSKAKEEFSLESGIESLDLYYVEDYEIEIDPYIRELIISLKPQSILCSEECKGICSGCFKDLNKEECICEKEINPSFEKLKELYN